MQRSENDIGCLQGSIDRVSVGLSGGVQRISEELQGEISRVSGGIVGYISLVCTVSRDAYIRFKDGFITWYGTDNDDGVIKYNTLIASGDWSLEEVEIEELL